MIKKIGLLATCVVSFSAFGCDVCGCSLGGFSQGVMPDYSSHFAGIRYQYTGFYSQVDHSSLNQGIEKSNDLYQRMDFVFRYNPGRRFKLNLTIPYVVNRMTGTNQVIAVAGLGDPVFMVNYQLLKEEWIKKNHFLTLGGGFKFPLGRYSISDSGQLVNRNFQPGSGSYDFLVGGNYFYRKNKNGIMAETAYKMNTANKVDYRFGNQFNAAVNYVRLATGKKRFSLLTFAGLYVEQAARHTQSEMPVFNTGGKALFANGGIQLYGKQMRIGTTFQYPVYQHYITDNLTQITAGSRFSADLVFFF